MAKTDDPRKLITDFVKDNAEVSAFQFIIADPEGVEIKMFEGGGLVNYVYRVQSKDHTSSVVLKYGEEKLRRVQEMEMTLERQTLEYNCLVLMHKLQPGSVPEPYCLDTKHNVLAMQDMNECEMLGDQLQQPRRYVDLNAPAQLGHLLSRLHRQTTQDSVSAEVWQEYQIKFKQSEMKQFMCDITFTRCFDETDPIIMVPDEHLQSFRSYVKDIKSRELDQIMLNMYHHETCFIHGDCHFKSIFVRGDQVVLFDFEFAFLGHPAINLAMLIGCYIILYIVDEEVTTDPEAKPSPALYKAQCLQACRNMMDAYLEEEVVGGYENFLSDLLLLTGSMLFLMCVFKSIDEILLLTDKARGAGMKAGHEQMMNYQSIQTLDDFMNAISV